MKTTLIKIKVLDKSHTILEQWRWKNKYDQQKWLLFKWGNKSFENQIDLYQCDLDKTVQTMGFDLHIFHNNGDKSDRFKISSNKRDYR